MKQTLIIFFLMLGFAKLGYSQNNAKSAESLKTFYTRIIDAYDVPGMAVAIVKNDSLVFSDGVGVLSVNDTHPVTSETMFGIASLTKTFVAGIFANAVAEVKIDYDVTLKAFLPEFQLYDNYVTNKLTFRDALSHRTGLGSFSGDLMWYGSTTSSDEILKRVRLLKPKYGFRTQFGYSNIMYLFAGMVLEDVYKNKFERIIDSMFFTPLGMKNTFVDYDRAMRYANKATPHIDFHKKVIPVPYISWNNIPEAGGVFSNVEDLSIYIKMLLNQGSYNNSVFINKEQLNELWKPQIQTGLSWLDTYFSAPVNFKAYGMGWAMMDFAGHKVLMHSGGLDGMVSQLVIVPDLNLGAVFLVNKASPLPAILMYDLLARETNDTTNFADGAIRMMKRYDAKEAAQSDVLVLSDTLFTNADYYAGDFYDSLVGSAKIFVRNDTLRVLWEESNIFEGVLRQTDVNSFDLFWPKAKSLGHGELIFEIDGNGDAIAFRIFLPNPDLHFNELFFRRQR